MNAQTNVSMAHTITFWSAWALLTVGLTYKINEMWGWPAAIVAAVCGGTGSFALLLFAWVFLPTQTKRAIEEWNKAKLAYAMSQAVK